MTIALNLQRVYDRIEKTAKGIGRDPRGIIVVAATKNALVSEIQEVAKANLKIVGENRVQDMLKKREELGDEVVWHFIGHLQRNKVKYIVEFVDLIQSVDSLPLAREIAKQALKIGKRQKILVEVNVSREESKYGLPPDSLFEFLTEISKMKSLQVQGLMTLAPLVEDKELTRPVFRSLKALAEKVKEAKIKNIEMRYLSMGMTNDFEVAIEEGSNMVRIGTAIFKDSTLH